MERLVAVRGLAEIRRLQKPFPYKIILGSDTAHAVDRLLWTTIRSLVCKNIREPKAEFSSNLNNTLGDVRWLFCN